MKLPKDALIEWRCGVCYDLCGYVRRIDGELRFTRAPRPIARIQPSEPREDYLVTPQVLADPEVFVSCGRHDSYVAIPDAFRVLPMRRNKVISIPIQRPGLRLAP